MAKGDDSRGRQSNTYQQQRYNEQQGPLITQAARNYGAASEANIGDYNQMMNDYRSLGAGGSGGGGGGGGGGASMAASHIGYNDPFKSYGGFEEFSKTGGYSAEDMANMRARGMSPLRAAYSNAEREIGRQRSLQGGYSPNAIATQAKMAREQGQGISDAMQSVEGGIVQDRNRNKLQGLGGMSGIEGQRLQADLDVSRFNAQADMAASASGASASNAASANNTANAFRSLEGQRLLYGTTPGMSETFGNQALNFLNSGANFGSNQQGHQYNNAQLPGDWDHAVSRGQQVSNFTYPWE